MKLTTRGRYGLLAMYELSINGGAPLPAAAIARNQDISETYLEQLLSALKKSRLIKSVRGAQGGYELAMRPDEITIGFILRALESSTAVTDCFGDERCGDSCRCVSRPVFDRIQRSVDEALDGMTLQDMIAGDPIV